MIFHENRLLADDSQKIPYLIFSKMWNDVAKLTSAAVVICELRAKHDCVPCRLRWSLFLREERFKSMK